ncbi:hypothetical protein OIU76_000234 [Salix suchowensis]|nr:hypothetical protein OIU76_000234 [Salix suchowensis]
MSREDIERGGGVKSSGSNNNSNRNGYLSTSTYVIEDAEAHYWTSWLVPMFVVANIVVFVVMMYINNCPKHLHTRFEGKCVARFLGRFSFEPLKDNPLFGPSSATLQRFGALEWTKVVHEHQGWRLISCMWLHAGIIHLLANMLSLVFIGIRLEQQFGFRNNISVGASGALFGLLGAMLSELITNWSIYTNKAAALFTLLVITAINLAIGILPHVDNFAHIGGFLSGFLLGFVLLLRSQYGWQGRRNLPSGAGVKSKLKAYQYALWLVSVALLIVGFTVALVMLFKGENGNDHCHWCHYLSCVPTSRWKCNENNL